MYLEHVSIHNFRALDNLEFDLKPGVNILLGDNGVGKTSILEALVIGLGGFLNGITGASSKGIQQSDIRLEFSKNSNSSISKSYKCPVEIECIAKINGKDFDWRRIRTDETSQSRTKLEKREIVHYAKDTANDPNATLPLLCYLSTARLSLPKRDDYGVQLQKKLNDRRCGYIGCMDYALDVKSIKAWCLKMEMEAFQNENPVPEYESFKEIVASVMEKMSDLPFTPRIFYSRKFEDLVYQYNNQILPISYLSAGYQSLLWISMDIAYRMALLNPNMDNLNGTHGIVMIDELDMHLHPKWQWKVLTVLEATFPNLQFIITTHAPILISSCKNEHLIQIDDNHMVHYLDSAYGYSIDEVVQYLQGSYRIPRLAQVMSDKFEAALDSNDITQARNILNEMKAEYGPNNTEVKIAEANLSVEDVDFSED